MKIITNNNCEIETKMVDVVYTTGGELRAQISIEPIAINFLDLVKLVKNGELNSFTVVRDDGMQELFTGFINIAKMSRRINEYNNDIFIELIHGDYTINQIDGDTEQ